MYTRPGKWWSVFCPFYFTRRLVGRLLGVKNQNKMEKIRRPVVYKKKRVQLLGLYLGPFVYFLSFVPKKKQKSRQKRNADDAAHWRKTNKPNGGAPERFFLSRQLDS
jgi:hypothetical protein